MAKGELRPSQKSSAAKKPAVNPSPAAMTKPAAVQRPPLTKPARMPKASAGPLTSRTKTLDDPLTTSLLAEVARRPATVDILPEQIAEVMAIARGDRDPDDPT
jgi:hypothetical protein